MGWEEAVVVAMEAGAVTALVALGMAAAAESAAMVAAMGVGLRAGARGVKMVVMEAWVEVAEAVAVVPDAEVVVATALEMAAAERKALEAAV